jgi:hypothetical protein
VTENRFLYTPREQRKLEKRLGRDPLHDGKGKGFCPFCEHLEARWRSSPGTDGRVEVRVVCSQCQRRSVYYLEKR